MALSVLWAEPSVYGFETESKSRQAIASLKRQVAVQKERIDGLTSVVEGLSAMVNQLQQQCGGGVAESDQALLLKDLKSRIDQIDAAYVSKKELQKILGGGKKEEDTDSVPSKEPTPSGTKEPADAKKSKASKASGASKNPEASKSSLAEKSSATLYSEGVRLFQKKRYDEAKKRFDITDTKGYKPAASNYYLGEIAYYTKRYEDAIFYFKKSAGLYDQASYIDTLLLHTAISLEKTGDKKQARRFYENIVANYPGKRTARIAKSKLKKL